MKKILLLALCSLMLMMIFPNFTIHKIKPNDNVCLSSEETLLYKLITNYRKSLKLDSIPLSNSLCYVALQHTIDLQLNKPTSNICNLHSWSNKGTWKPCCYTADHKQAQCMWDKPRELTTYTGDGYEISTYYSAGMTAEQALNAWKKSKGHNEVISNQGIWKKIHWNAIGVAIYKNYSVVWFGRETDPEGSPKCK